MPAVGTGIAYPQAANASTLSFGNSETYGFKLTQNNGSEFDATGEMVTTVNGVVGSITGNIEDLNTNDFNGGSLPLIDTFTLPADSFGRIAGTFRNSPSNGPGPFFDYYLIDDNHGFMIEMDLLNPGVLSPGISLGYFAQSCDVANAATSCQQSGGILPKTRR